MNELEMGVASLLSCKEGKCAFLRTRPYINLRLKALYAKEPFDPIVVYGEGIKLVLTDDRRVEVFVTQAIVDPDLVGDTSGEPTRKRKACASDEEDGDI